MTVDVEEYYHAENVMAFIGRERASALPSRVVPSVERILELFASAGAKATFFVLGRVAEAHPGLVPAIRAAGHEVASHGYDHIPMHRHTPLSFDDDLKRSLAVLSGAGTTPVKGYRSASFSLVKDMEWFFDALKKSGLAYDSSVAASVFRAHYDAGLLQGPFRAGGNIMEVPVSSGRLGPLTVPLGGGYFRALPYGTFSGMVKRVQAAGGVPVVYLHPWEMDPGQPRFDLPLVKRLRHYINLGETEKRLKRLLEDFRFISMSEFLKAQYAGEYADR
jgi:polysaccharide deacetylase family protein (PEP-CTERM system associated)